MSRRVRSSSSCSALLVARRRQGAEKRPTQIPIERTNPLRVPEAEGRAAVEPIVIIPSSNWRPCGKAMPLAQTLFGSGGVSAESGLLVPSPVQWRLDEDEIIS